MAKLFTVTVTVYDSTDVTQQFTIHRAYECEFAGLHFSRTREADLQFWVRVAAQHIYGKDTQVIFLHERKG